MYCKVTPRLYSGRLPFFSESEVSSQNVKSTIKYEYLNSCLEGLVGERCIISSAKFRHVVVAHVILFIYLYYYIRYLAHSQL